MWWWEDLYRLQVALLSSFQLERRALSINATPTRERHVVKRGEFSAPWTRQPFDVCFRRDPPHPLESSLRNDSRPKGPGKESVAAHWTNSRSCDLRRADVPFPPTSLI